MEIADVKELLNNGEIVDIECKESDSVKATDFYPITDGIACP